MAGSLVQVRPKTGAKLVFQYDPEQCEPTGGVGGWTEVPRPRVIAGTEFSGTPLFKLSFDLMMDGWAERKSIEPQLAQLYAWGQRSSNGEPAVLQLNYGVYSKMRWVLQDVTVANTLRRLDGHRVQAVVSVTLMEYLGLTAKSTPADSVRSGIIAANVAAGQAHKNPTVSTYTVVKGDTLQRIAAHKLGNANRWQEIASLNHIKDPIHLHVGAKIKLPAK